ncbi:hypothetical protein BHE90_017092 [Fusarium euwallaceae]|uniref:Uncharacterized protein n=1 Tax=Fusarium euwallaceae TaxID=1147111 RepID=A0A430KYI8_9HYPO|nr:hypothetical protein BHE90_017092 [Fusarium euwallaceae]
MAAESICYRGDNGYDARYQGREPPDLEDPAYWDRRLQDFKAKTEQARRTSPSNCVFTFAELDELEGIEKAKKAHRAQLVDDEFGTGNRIEEGIQQWVDSLQRNDLERPFSPASIPSSVMDRISRSDDSNTRCPSEESLVNKTRLRDVECWEAKAEFFNGQLRDPADYRISESESRTPSPPISLNVVYPGTQHFVHGWRTATPTVQLGRSLKRKTCHPDPTVSITHSTESPVRADLNNNSVGMPTLKKGKHDCKKRQGYPTQPSRLRRSARIAVKEGCMDTTPEFRRSARIAARRGRSPI